MGSLITALQNQRIDAANRETLQDLYAANPVNVGFTENPFKYNPSPAVVQTAYPKYGYNATAPVVPPSYEDYDLTTLFSMLQSIQAPQQDGQMQTFMAPMTLGGEGISLVEGGPVTPAGILAAMSSQPVSGAYGTEPVVAEEEDTQAADDERINQMIANALSNQKRKELEQRYTKVTGLPVDPNQSSWELTQVLDDPSSPFNVTGQE